MIDNCQKKINEKKKEVSDDALPTILSTLFFSVIIAGIILFFTIGAFSNWDWSDSGNGWNRFIANPIAVTVLVGIAVLPSILALFIARIKCSSSVKELKSAKRTHKRATALQKAGHSYIDEARAETLKRLLRIINTSKSGRIFNLNGSYFHFNKPSKI